MKEEREAEARRRDIAERKKQEKDDGAYKKKLQAKLAIEKEARAAERKKEREDAGGAKADSEGVSLTPAEKARAAAAAQKKADLAARKAVQDRIAADRAGRRGEPAPGKPNLASKSSGGASGATKIAFRLPDGRVEKHSFPAGERLEAAVAVVEGWLNESQSFQLANTFPRRVYTMEDMGLTLSELDLAPSAMLEVQLRDRGSGLPVSNQEGLPVSNQEGLVPQLVALLVWLLALLNPANWGSSPTDRPRAEVPPVLDPHNVGSSTGARPQGSSAARRAAASVGTPMAGGGRHVTLAELNGGPGDRDTNERYNGDSTSLE